MALPCSETDCNTTSGRSPHIRRASVSTRILLCICLPLLVGANLLHARQDKKAETPPANAAATPAGPAESPPQHGNFLAFCYFASPTFFVLMSLISIYLGTLVVNGFLRFRSKIVLPPALLAKLDEQIREKQYREAYETAKANPSLFGRALATGAERLGVGFDKATDAMLAIVDDGKMAMEHAASPVAMIGALGPLLGLLGTVMGMIQAFQEIATGGQPRPAELARSIGLALVSTLEGLIVAIPAIFFFGIFRNKIARLAFDVETLAQDYLARLSAAVKKP